jgi:hypothetical protein
VTAGGVVSASSIPACQWAGERHQIADSRDELVVSQNFTSWNQIAEWLKSLQHLRAVA